MKIISEYKARQMTILLRVDEDQAIRKILQEYLARPHGEGKTGFVLTRHFIIKYAIRRYLFPEEKLIPLDGFAVEILPTGKTMLHNYPLTHDIPSLGIAEGSEHRKQILKKEPEKRFILKKISEKDKKELERLGVPTE